MSNSSDLVPALQPPPGEHSNFVDPPSLRIYGIVDAVVCLTVSSIVFGLRTYIRAFLKRQWILEDYMACLSYAGFVVYIALLLDVMNNHGGIHQWNLTVPQVHAILYRFNVIAILYGPMILFTKYTILLLYSRVFAPRRWSPLDVVIKLYMLVSLLFYFAITVVKIWECTPRERIWDSSVEGTCVDAGMVLSVSGVFNTVSDVLILLIPVKSVWNLHTSTKKKIDICLVFAIGLIAPVFNAIGVYVRFQTNGSKDTSYNSPLILLWGTAEVCSGVICTCLPVLPALFKRDSSRKPGSSIIDGSTDRRNPRSFQRHSQFPPNSDHELLNDTYLELNEDYQYGRGTKTPFHAITTNIKGGATTPQATRSRSPEASDRESEDSGKKSLHEGGIMRTVRIEQSNV